MNRAIEETFKQTLRVIALTPGSKEDLELMELVADIHTYLNKYSEKSKQ